MQSESCVEKMNVPFCLDCFAFSATAHLKFSALSTEVVRKVLQRAIVETNLK